MLPYYVKSLIPKPHHPSINNLALPPLEHKREPRPSGNPSAKYVEANQRPGMKSDTGTGT